MDFTNNFLYLMLIMLTMCIILIKLKDRLSTEQKYLQWHDFKGLIIYHFF